MLAKRNFLFALLCIFGITLLVIFIYMRVKTPYDFGAPAQMRWRESSLSTDSPIISISANENNKNVIYAVSANSFFISGNAGVFFKKVFATNTGSKTIKSHMLFLHRVVFVPSLGTAVFALENNNKDQIFSYNCADGKIRKIFEINALVTDIENKPHSDLIFIATYGKGIYAAKGAFFKQVVKLSNISHFYFTSIGFLPDGRVVAGLEKNPGQSLLPIIESDKNGNFNDDMVHNISITRNEVPINIQSVYCIRSAKRGIYISTNSEFAPIIFTNDGKNFSIVKRVKETLSAVYGIRCVEPVDKYDGFFFTTEDENYLSGKSYPDDLVSPSVCFMRTNAKSPIVCLSPSPHNNAMSDNLINIKAFLFIASSKDNRIIISTGSKLYTAIITKRILFWGSPILPKY